MITFVTKLANLYSTSLCDGPWLCSLGFLFYHRFVMVMLMLPGRLFSHLIYVG